MGSSVETYSVVLIAVIATAIKMVSSLVCLLVSVRNVFR